MPIPSGDLEELRMRAGTTIMSFIVTLWRDPASEKEQPNDWRGSIRPVTAEDEEDTEQQLRAVPFRGFEGVGKALQNCLDRFLMGKS